ncbi:hypothetical protein RvY_17295 [Ramazzottius varieornatus]|uniref:Kazal-like domain-containing protein n=1 Tax=Ramazzottius varieornatus TaxID=947166 RepID=A0A1D1W1M2_RAMVA|nr:hypothetical protein RvY_17295 [Ramazzottius varieornatus]
MGSPRLVLSALLCLFVFTSAGSFAQNPVEATTEVSLALEGSPPNCICPAIPVATTTTTTTTTPRPGRPWRPRPPSSHPSRRPTHLCGNDGRNYTTFCAFINAQALNNSLGLRLCAGQNVPNFPNFDRPGHFNGNRPGQFSSHRPRPPFDFPLVFPGFENCNATASLYRHPEPRVCLTNDRDVRIREAQRVLRANTIVGVRCLGCCPCTLRCPPAFIAGYPAVRPSGRY